MVQANFYVYKQIFLIFLLSNLLINFLPGPGNSDRPDNQFSLKTHYDILPYPLSRGSAVWVEGQESIYIFGGRNETDILGSIMKYTPATNDLVILNTVLPNVLMGTTAIYDGEHIYIFGGRDWQTFYDTILRFEPKTETITIMTAHLPKPAVGSAGIWTGGYIFLFGGGAMQDKYDWILRYDPKIDNITIMNSNLTYGRTGLAATWDAQNETAYIIGGSDGSSYSREVFKYWPKNDTLVMLPGALPGGRLHIQAQYHDGAIYIFGGRGGPTLIYDQILIYNLITDKIRTLNLTLPNPCELRMHAYDGENIYIIGGFVGPDDINQFIIFSFKEEEANSTGLVCPEDNPYIPLVIIVLILVFILIIKLARGRSKKI